MHMRFLYTMRSTLVSSHWVCENVENVKACPVTHDSSVVKPTDTSDFF